MSWEDILKNDVEKLLKPDPAGFYSEQDKRDEELQIEQDRKLEEEYGGMVADEKGYAVTPEDLEFQRTERKRKREEKTRRQLQNQLNPKESFREKVKRTLGFGSRSPEEKQIAGLKIQAEEEENARIAEENRLAEQAEIATEDEEDAKAARSKTAKRGAETRRTRKEGDDWLTEIREDMETEDEEIAEKERLASLSPEEWRKEKTPALSALVDKPRGETAVERLLRKPVPKSRFQQLREKTIASQPKNLERLTGAFKDFSDERTSSQEQNRNKLLEALRGEKVDKPAREKAGKEHHQQAYDKWQDELRVKAEKEAELAETERREKEERLGPSARAQMRNTQGDAAQMVFDTGKEIYGAGKEKAGELYGKGKDWWNRVKAKKRIKDRRKAIASDDDDFDERFSRLRQPKEESKESWWDSVAKPKIESTSDWAKHAGKNLKEGWEETAKPWLKDAAERRTPGTEKWHQERWKQQLGMAENQDKFTQQINDARRHKKKKIMAAEEEKAALLAPPESERKPGWKRQLRNLNRKIPTNWKAEYGDKTTEMPEVESSYKMPTRDVWDWKEALHNKKVEREESGEDTTPFHQRMLNQLKLGQRGKTEQPELMEVTDEIDPTVTADWREGSMGETIIQGPKEGDIKDYNGAKWRYDGTNWVQIKSAHEANVDPNPVNESEETKPEGEEPEEEEKPEEPQEEPQEETVQEPEEPEEPPKETFAEEEEQEEEQ